MRCGVDFHSSEVYVMGFRSFSVSWVDKYSVFGWEVVCWVIKLLWV